MPQDDTKTSPCETCGALVEYRKRRFKFCPDCMKQRIRERDRQTKELLRRKRGIEPVKGTQVECVDCRKQFTRYVIHSVRCQPCQSAFVLAKANKASTEKRRARNAPQFGDESKCKECGKPFKRRASRNYYCEPCTALSKKNALPFMREWQKTYSKEWVKQNYQGARRAEYQAMNHAKRERRKQNPAFTLNERMSAGIRQSLKNGKQGYRWEQLAGYTVDELKRHLERQFLKGMSWDNMGEWHIDHIVPLSSFQYESFDDPAFKACWDLANLRPLWAKDNLSKNNRRFYLI